MPKGTKVEWIRNEFAKSVAAARKIVDAIAHTKLGPRQKEKVYEMAFLYVFAAWEQFLEETFVRYMTGARTDYLAPTLKVGKCTDISHACRVLSGNPKYVRGKDSMSWTNAESVVERAKVFFVAGNPFSLALVNYRMELNHARIFRHHVAHGSYKSRKDFTKAVGTYKSQSANSASGDSVGRLLCSPFKRKFAHLPKNAQPTTYFDAFLSMFEDAARAIVP